MEMNTDRTQKDIGSRLGSLSEKQRALLALKIKANHKGEAKNSYVPLKAMDREGKSEFISSYSQKRFWFLDQFNENKATNHTHLVTRLTGKLDLKALQQSVDKIIERHEVLRMRYTNIEDEVYCVPIEHPQCPIELQKIRAFGKEKKEQKWEETLQEILCRPFDLQNQIPIRVVVVNQAKDDNYLIVVIHHIASDMWSLRLFNQELQSIYNAITESRECTLPETPIQYMDYAQWQRDRLEDRPDQEDITYWKKTLEGVPPYLRLTSDKPRPAIQTSDGDSYKFFFTQELIKKIQDLSVKEQVTPFVITLSAFGVLLSKYANMDDFVIGSPIAGRIRKETENVIGAFINTLALRFNVCEDPTIHDLYQKMKFVVGGAMAHQEYPFEKLIHELKIPQNLSYTSLFQVMFNFQSTQKQEIQLNGLTSYSPMASNHTTKFDLNMAVKFLPEEVMGQLVYNTDLFERKTIGRFIDQYLNVLDQMVGDISVRISALDPVLPEEKQIQLTQWNQSEQTEYEKIPYMHQLFERGAKLYPDDIAAVYEGRSYTYQQLNEKSNQFARYLRSQGVTVEKPVGLFVDRSLDLLVGMLGILKAGGAYVPLDPIYPIERINYIAKDAGLSQIVTQKALLPQLEELVGVSTVVIDEEREYASLDTTDFESGLKPENLFYILYTSGSTGNPKGVAVEHRNYINYYFGVTKRMGLEPKLRYAIASTFAADLATINVWAALSTGGQIHILSQELSVDPMQYARYFKQNRIDVIKMVPSHFKSLSEMAPIADITPNRLLILAGEASYWDMIDRIQQEKPEARIQIHYGPTETTVSMLTYEVTKERPLQYTTTLPLGRPLPNVSIYVLDEQMRPVPTGSSGELYIGGPGLSRGYYGREQLTKERFISNPFSDHVEDRLYKTGDAVRFLKDGSIEFLGRIDDQVKVKGFRIELGEVNAQILAYPGIVDAYAMVREDVPGNKVLTAYIVTGQEEISTGELRNALSIALPHYMIPSAFVVLDKIPLNPNGKVNKFMLPAPDHIDLEMETEYVEPETEEEIALAEVWQEVLGVEKIGINHNFFAMGGDSFKAVQVIRSFEGALGIMDVFRYATIKELAKCLSVNKATGNGGAKELLYQMTMHDEKEEDTALICIPFAGGSAIAYRELADQMPEQVSLYAVQIPGHDMSQKDGELIPLREVAAGVVDEICKKVTSKKVAVYGHCLGGALGVEIARRLEQISDKELVGVFMGGNFPASILPGKFFQIWNKLFPRDKRMSNRAYMDMLRSLGGFPDDLSKDETDSIIRSLRHDRRESEKYYCDCYADKEYEKLDVPIRCIIGELDRTTEFYPEQYHDWEFFSDYVDYQVIRNAGHYFFKHQAGILAKMITDTLESWDNKEYIKEKEEREKQAELTKDEPKPSLITLLVFIMGQLVSLMGSGVMGFAIGQWLYNKTDSTLTFALTLIFNRLPGIIILPFAGTLADRFDRKKILIASNLCSAVVTLLLAMSFVNDSYNLMVIFIANSILSVTNSFQRPAYLAAVAQITPKRYLGQANGIVQLATSASDIIAPALGAFLITILSLSKIIYINMGSFLFCLFTLCMIKFPNTLYHVDDETFLQQLVGGFRFIVKRKSFIALVIYFMITNLMLGIANVLVTPLAYTFGMQDPQTFIGLVTSATGIGGLLGGIAMSLWGGTKRRSEGMIGFGFLLGIGYMIMGSRPYPVYMLVGVFIYGASMALVNAHWQTLIQSKVRAELLARVFAINQMFALPTLPLGYYIGGQLSDKIFKPLFATSPKAVEMFGWLVGTGEERGLALLFLLIGLTAAIWAIISLKYKPLRYMDDILPNAIPGAIFTRDRDQLQREEDAQLQAIKIREKQITKKSNNHKLRRNYESL